MHSEVLEEAFGVILTVVIFETVLGIAIFEAYWEVLTFKALDVLEQLFGTALASIGKHIIGLVGKVLSYKLERFVNTNGVPCGRSDLM